MPNSRNTVQTMSDLNSKKCKLYVMIQMTIILILHSSTASNISSENFFKITVEVASRDHIVKVYTILMIAIAKCFLKSK